MEEVERGIIQERGVWEALGQLPKSSSSCLGALQEEAGLDGGGAARARSGDGVLGGARAAAKTVEQLSGRSPAGGGTRRRR